MTKYKIVAIFIIMVFFISELHSQEIIKIDSIDKNHLEELITYREGKVLLLNIWATWCVPCREEFPDLVKINKEFNSRVDVVSISTDYPEEVKDKVLPFLKKVDADFKTYVNDFKIKSDLIDFLEMEWNGALPATFIYDSKGVRKFFFQGKKSFKEFKAALTELLN